MIEDRLKFVAKRFALVGKLKARSSLWVSIYILAAALVVAVFAFVGGNPASFYSAAFLLVIAVWSFQRAGYVLLLEERSGEHSDKLRGPGSSSV